MKHHLFAVAAMAACLGPLALAADVYNPVIEPANFSTEINNPLLTLKPGKTFVYAAKTEEGDERVEIRIRNEVRTIMGVETIVYNDRVFANGQLKEETSDYLAQDKDGNVWYFGEEVDNYEKGVFKDHDGSWIAGVDGALPGIWFKGKPKVGEQYRQEYYKGEAEDMAKVLATDATVTVKAGTFKNCTKVEEWNPVEPDSAKEHKYYCPGVAGQALSEKVGQKFSEELISVVGG